MGGEIAPDNVQSPGGSSWGGCATQGPFIPPSVVTQVIFSGGWTGGFIAVLAFSAASVT